MAAFLCLSENISDGGGCWDKFLFFTRVRDSDNGKTVCKKETTPGAHIAFVKEQK